MKGLSLMQPYAELVVLGRKTIELRKWNTKHRGYFYVHASSKTDAESCKGLGLDPKRLAHGSIIGKAYLYEVRTYKTRREFAKDKKRHFAEYRRFKKSKYGFMLKNAKKFKRPIKYKGMLNFFDVKL